MRLNILTLWRKTTLLIEWPYKLTVVLIIALTAIIGWRGATWGQPYAFHSGEWRYLSRVAADPSAPIWTIYGRWPIYFQRIAAQLAGQSPVDLVLARQVTLLVSLSGLVMSGLAARQLAGWRGAMLAVALVAGAPIVSQTANFFITDVWLYAGFACGKLRGVPGLTPFCWLVHGASQWVVNRVACSCSQ
jgi:hypothetical protein